MVTAIVVFIIVVIIIVTIFLSTENRWKLRQNDLERCGKELAQDDVKWNDL